MARRSYRPTMDTYTELRQLADDLTELGDNATAMLVLRAMDRFSAWKFEAGEELLARALEERERYGIADAQPDALSRYFASCALAVA